MPGDPNHPLIPLLTDLALDHEAALETFQQTAERLHDLLSALDEADRLLRAPPGPFGSRADQLVASGWLQVARERAEDLWALYKAAAGVARRQEQQQPSASESLSAPH